MTKVNFRTDAARDADLRIEISEESLRLAAEAAEVGTWDLDLQADVLTWSDRTRQMFGIWTDAPVSMADFYGGLHPDDFDATAAAFASAIDPAVRATYDVEYRTIGKEDGVIRWVAARGKGLFVDGVCRRAIGTAIDITARRRAAVHHAFVLELTDILRQLSSSGEILHTAVKALGQHLGADRVGYGQVQADGDSIVLATCYANEVETLSGSFPLNAFGAHNVARQRRGVTVAIDDLAKDPRNDFATWDSIQTRALVSVPLVRGEQLRATLFVNYRGPRAWTAEEVALIEDVAGRIWDTLERSRAEEEIRQLNASLEHQVEARTHERDRIWRLAPVLLVVGDDRGRLLEANPAWTEVLGWSQEETIGRDVMDFVAPEDRVAGAAGMAQLFAGQSVMEYQLTFVTKDGARRKIAWTTVPEGDRLHGHGRDVTDQLAAEERLRQAQKMEAVGQLTSGIAHDFNNLLTGIIGGLDLMERRISQGRTGELGPYIDAAQSGARRAAALTHRLLAYSRQQTLDSRPVNVSQLVAGMNELVRQSVGPGFDIRVQSSPEPWRTLVDSNQLENALLNLCINARDAMPGGGVLTISTANHDLDAETAAAWDLPAGEFLSLSVTDNGIGMAPETIRRAFDPFFTTKPLGEGTGLGLSMIYGFARQSKGQVRIESELGRGACVSILLPRYVGDAEVGEPGASPTTHRGLGCGKTVLVVEDEDSIRMIVTELLGELGYNVVEALDGAGGLQALKSAIAVDLLVTDVGLPGGMTGLDLAEAARGFQPGLRVLFITGYADNAALKDAKKPGVRVLTKPFTLDLLAAHVAELETDPQTF